MQHGPSSVTALITLTVAMFFSFIPPSFLPTSLPPFFILFKLKRSYFTMLLHPCFNSSFPINPKLLEAGGIFFFSGFLQGLEQESINIF